MAEGNEPKPINMLVLQHQFTISEVSISPGAVESLINNQTLSSLTFQTLDPIPTGRTLKGVYLLWANGSIVVPVDILVNNDKVTLRVINFTSNIVKITTVRILAFWE